MEIAKRSRFTPRTANYFLKRVRDFGQINKTDLTQETVSGALKLLGVDEKGLTPSDREILNTIINKFAGGPVGLSTIASSLSEEEATIEDFNEPYLMQVGFIERTPRGRVVTEHGYKHLSLIPPQTS
jgi:Holliday junction DNA helicase RuvB